MKITEYLKEILSFEDSNKTNFVETLYDIKLSDEIKKITDNINESIDFEYRGYLRLLSKKEIIDASKDMNINFIEKGIIPIFDTGDNDYISFNINKSKWCKFNIVDEIDFSLKDNIIDFFN